MFLVSVEAAGGKALACVVDIRDEKQVDEAVQKAVDKFGGMTTFFTVLNKNIRNDLGRQQNSTTGNETN